MFGRAELIAFGVGALVALLIIAEFWLQIALFDFVLSIRERILRRLFHWY